MSPEQGLDLIPAPRAIADRLHRIAVEQRLLRRQLKLALLAKEETDRMASKPDREEVTCAS
jgi:hypothetical protein